jgi:hypothetical protein
MRYISLMLISLYDECTKFAGTSGFGKLTHAGNELLVWHGNVSDTFASLAEKGPSNEENRNYSNQKSRDH